MKNTSIKKPLAVITTAVITVIGCTHEMPTPPSPATTGGGTTGGGTTGTGTTINQVCFEGDVLPIFQSNCAKSGCHDVTSHQKDYVLNSYANILRGVTPGNTDESKIYKFITEKDEDKRMPKFPNPRLSASQIDLIKRWINEGAENTSNCSSTCNETVFTYSQAIRPILDANCVGCHNGGSSAPSHLNYTTYQGIQAVALNGKLIGAITHSGGFSPMPKNSPKLSDCNINQIQKWIQAGAPNN